MKKPTIGVTGTGDFSAYLIAACEEPVLAAGFSYRLTIEQRRKLATAHSCAVAVDDASMLAEAYWMLLAVRPETCQSDPNGGRY
ncbi:hypothetical protein QN222_18605 [Sinorhizobium sp. 6-70]|nr:hypothetical protein [Sinorhizobium sp. 6-70]MDK1376496.1 hypothetical protein [Sinorhizobium sp. 6-70]